MRDTRTSLRLMVWNLCRGGQGTPAGDVLDEITDLIVDLAPDILCCTETHGATDRILQGCHRVGLTGYHAHRLAAEGTDDNLAIVTRLPLRATLPSPAGRSVDSYNFGGLRLGLPGGADIAVFDTWLRFDVDVVDALEATARELAAGQDRTRTDEELALLELPQLANIEEILVEHLPAAVPDGATPVILAGGFNTESHLDATWVDLPYRPHWQVTRRLAKAGFQDAYRAAHPDARRYPGGTFNVLDPDQMLPHRIDYAFVTGAGVEVADARVVDTRLAAHGPGPFYSDHGALVVDLLARDGDGTHGAGA